MVAYITSHNFLKHIKRHTIPSNMDFVVYDYIIKTATNT